MKKVTQATQPTMTFKEKKIAEFEEKFRNGATSTKRNVEIISFLSSVIDEYSIIIKEKVCEHSFDTTADVEFVLSALNL